MTQPVCLTIAGSDSGGEAGVQADLQTFQDFNCHGLSAITAVTAQNPKEIISLNEVDVSTVQDQLLALKNFFEIKYIKTGILPSAEIMRAILEIIPDDATLISDPLIQSTSGKELMSDKTLAFFKEHFIKRVNFLTPNIPELETLTESSFSSEYSVKEIIQKLSCDNVFLKGGHSTKPGLDYFYDGRLWKLEAPEVKIKSSHGTGCRISSALCAALASGNSALDAAILAKNYVYHALKNCHKTKLNQWLLGSPGNQEYLENKIEVSEII